MLYLSLFRYLHIRTFSYSLFRCLNRINRENSYKPRLKLCQCAWVMIMCFKALCSRQYLALPESFSCTQDYWPQYQSLWLWITALCLQDCSFLSIYVEHFKRWDNSIPVSPVKLFCISSSSCYVLKKIIFAEIWCHLMLSLMHKFHRLGCTLLETLGSGV